MSSASLTPPNEGSNDLSKHIGQNGRGNQGPGGEEGHVQGLSSAQAKRIACVICRKRKLKCDGSIPKCSTCKRLNHACAYDEVRRKSGPKRGYVKALEERLSAPLKIGFAVVVMRREHVQLLAPDVANPLVSEQVETQLKNQDIASDAPQNVPTTTNNGQTVSANAPFTSIPSTQANSFNPAPGLTSGAGIADWRYNGGPIENANDLVFTSTLELDLSMGMDNNFPWEMIGLGLEEPLPPQESINELHQIYFDKIHPSTPMVHKYRYLAAMNLAPHQRPPVSLRYAMWCLAASVTDKYTDLRNHFYQRARKYMEMDALKGHGEQMISVGHAQTHILLASYEFKMMHFPRAWMSTGAGVRMCQMMGLHRLDGAGLDVKECLPPPRDWTEKEERRRTFWMAFCEDRYASIGTGWPMTIDEADILTNLPASEEAYDMSEPEDTLSLSDSFSASGTSKISPFAGIAVMACLFGKNLTHLHRPTADDRDDDLDGEFWRRHRNMDIILLNVTLSLPEHLKLPHGLSNPNNIFTNMNIHTSTICLHQAALYKAAKNNLPASVSAESKMRCISAANEITGIMRMISHLDLSIMNPFIAFCLYVAARVFIQYLKSRPDDSQTGDSLRFLLSAMNALKKRNPLTESFLVQLDVDLEGLGMRHSQKATWGGSTAQQVHVQDKQECFFMPRDAISSGGQVPMTEPQNTPKSYENPEWLSLPTQPNIDQQAQPASPGLVPEQIPQTQYNPGVLNASRYVRSEGSMSFDLGQSPSNHSNSNRPTSSATTPSDSHSTIHSAQLGSKAPSFAASPSTGQIPPAPMSAFFSTQPDYTGIPATGMPDVQGTLAGNAGWDMDVQQQSTGLTNVDGGVIRHVLGMSSLDPMDLWHGG